MKKRRAIFSLSLFFFIFSFCSSSTSLLLDSRQKKKKKKNMPRNHFPLPILLFLLLLILSTSAALARAPAGVEKRAREWRIGDRRSFYFSAPPNVSGDDDAEAFPPPPSNSPSFSPSPPSAELDALAARVAARLEPVLLRALKEKEEGELGEMEKKERKNKKGSGSGGGDSPSSSPPPPSSTTSSPFKTFLQALLGASVASALLLAGERLERRKKDSARSRADLLDALRSLDDASARRLLGQVGLPGWAK